MSPYKINSFDEIRDILKSDNSELTTYIIAREQIYLKAKIFLFNNSQLSSGFYNLFRFTVGLYRFIQLFNEKTNVICREAEHIIEDQCLKPCLRLDGIISDLEQQIKMHGDNHTILVMSPIRSTISSKLEAAISDYKDYLSYHFAKQILESNRNV